ncbi:MAG: DUF1513 domain-containing protein [Hyphomicrobium sp.]
MAIDRRSLLLGTLSAVSLDALRGNAFAVAAGEAAFIAAAQRADQSYAVLLIAGDGTILRDVPLSARGHDIALHAATRRAVVFARRPGTFAVAFATGSPAPPQVFNAIEGRHFYGHGAFSNDGRLLYVAENDIANARGVVGVYDVEAGYRRIGEHPSHGVGPHEIILLADGKTLAIANGGIDTVPDAGRESLNIEAMLPNLAFVDAGSGALRARHEPPSGLNRLSIRHIAADRHGVVWFGGQWEGAAAETPELIGCAGPEQSLRLIVPAAPMGTALKGYIGSVAASGDGEVIAASAPKAGRILYIAAATGTILGESTVKDGCGIAGEDGAAFAVTSGLGAFRHETAGAQMLSETNLPGIAFDNHLRRLK